MAERGAQCVLRWQDLLHGRRIGDFKMHTEGAAGVKPNDSAPLPVRNGIVAVVERIDKIGFTIGDAGDFDWEDV